jgi:hypothetical protein
LAAAKGSRSRSKSSRNAAMLTGPSRPVSQEDEMRPS